MGFRRPGRGRPVRLHARDVRVGGLDIPDGKLEHTNRYEAVLPGVFDAMIRELGIAYEKFLL
jgi:hypothetical protein